MSHFSYPHLPAQGLGHRDPRRPHVTGGIGDGVPVFVGDLGGTRTFAGDRIMEVMEREGQLVRAYVGSVRSGTTERVHAKTSRSGSTDRTYTGERTTTAPSRDYSGGRSYDKKER